MAGKDWYYTFLKRHPVISLRQSQFTSTARAKGFSKQLVYEFFDIFEKISGSFKLEATEIYNVDESGYSTVKKKNRKILGQKGRNRIGVLASRERGGNTTVVCCVSKLELHLVASWKFQTLAILIPNFLEHG